MFRRPGALVIAIAVSATMLGIGLPGARADEAFQRETYTFESDTLGARPAGVTIQTGDFEVATDLPLGKAMRAKAQGGPMKLASATFDRALGSRISVVWRETSILGGDSHGFTLRHSGDRDGYLFLVNGVTAFEPNTVGIYKTVNGSTIKLTSQTLVWSPRRTFVAEADGNYLRLMYKDEGVPWATAAAVHDWQEMITAGGVQYSGGWNGSDATRTTIDDVDAHFLPVAGVLDLMSPSSHQVLQRDADGLTDIDVRGGYAGKPTAIEARVGDGPWQVLDPAPRSGRFAGRLVGQADGQRDIEVRFANIPTVTDRSASVGLGDLFVVAGQSNAVGHGWNANTATHPTWRAAVFGNDYRWRPLVDPVDSAIGQLDQVSMDGDAGGSVWPLVGTSLMADQNVPVAFIPAALNGSYIDQWQRSATDPFGRSTLYGSMANRILSAGGKVRAVLFWQGETDAFNGMSGEVYRARLEQLAADLRNDFGAPLVAAQIGEGDIQPVSRLDAIRMAQRQAWEAGTVVAGPSLYDVHLSDEGDDGVHFASDGDMRTAASRWTAAIRAGIYGFGDGRGPRLTSATVDLTRTIISVQLSDASPLAGGLAGFTVKVGGSAVPVAAVSLAGDTYTLRLGAKAPAGVLTVSLGEGHSGAGQAVPADAQGLPAEVFLNALVV